MSERKQVKIIPDNWKSTSWCRELVPVEQVVRPGNTAYAQRKEIWGPNRKQLIPTEGHTPDHHFVD